MKLTYEERIDQTDWDSFSVSAFRAGELPSLLKRLKGGTPADQERACAVLWNGLCHQWIYTCRAALPATPFLLEALEEADGQLLEDLMDIFYGLVVCTHPRHKQDSWLEPTPVGWFETLRQLLLENQSRFAALVNHSNPEVAAYAQRIMDEWDHSSDFV